MLQLNIDFPPPLLFLEKNKHNHVSSKRNKQTKI